MNLKKKKAEDILYHIVRNPTNETLSIIRLIKNACLKLYNLAHTATNSPLNQLVRIIQMFSCSKSYSPLRN